MNFNEIKLLGKGTVRKSSAGSTRESNFHFRYAHYTKQTKTGDQLVSLFAFTAGAMEKLGFGASDKGAVPFFDEATATAGIALVPAASSVFLSPAKRGDKKATNVTVPSLVDAIAASGLLDKEFSGSQYYNLEQVGENEGVVYFKVVAAEVPAKAYNPREEAEAEAEVNAATAEHNTAE